MQKSVDCTPPSPTYRIRGRWPHTSTLDL